MLFLCAGVVIHGTGGIQDIRSLGLIWYVSPGVRIRFLIANLALSGFPFLRGFYSKDIILEVIYILNMNIVLILMLVIATIFTVIYSLRLRYYCLWRGCYDTSYICYQDTNLIVYPIFIMSMIVTFLGSLLGWYIFPEPVFIYLTQNIKIINILIVFSPLCIYILLLRFNLVSGAIRELSHFLGGIWFLPILTGGGITIFLKNIKNYHIIVDQAWIEEVASQGVYTRGVLISYRLRARTRLGLNSLLIIIFSVLCILLLL